MHAQKDSQLEILREEADLLKEKLESEIRSVSEKDIENQNVNKKFQQLREEAKTRLKDLKAKNEELTKSLDEKEQQLMNKLDVSSVEYENKIKQMKIDHDNEVDDLKTFHKSEFEELNLDKSAEIKVLSDKLEQERENMKSFKENVKKQFEDRQASVKITISNMKLRFDEQLKEREEIHEKK